MWWDVDECGALAVVELLLGSWSRGSKVLVSAVLCFGQCVVGRFNLWRGLGPVWTEGLEKALRMGCCSSVCSCTCAFKLYVGLV